MSRHTSLTIALATVLLANVTFAQTAKSLETRWRDLSIKLESKPPKLSEQIKLLESFVVASVTEKATALETRARLRLARTLVFAFQPKKARAQFERLAQGAAARSERDLLGRALYGQLRCLELSLDLDGCRRLCKRLKKEFPDTRYGKLAEVVQKRLVKRKRLRNGKSTPDFKARLDLTGKARSHKQLAGKPALLVFWSPDSPASIASMERLFQAWTRARGEKEQFLAICVHHDRARAEGVVKKRRLQHPVLLAGDNFLDPMLLDYEVRGVPASHLLGPDQVLLGRDVSASEITRRLKVLLAK